MTVVCIERSLQIFQVLFVNVWKEVLFSVQVCMKRSDPFNLSFLLCDGSLRPIHIVLDELDDLTESAVLIRVCKADKTMAMRCPIALMLGCEAHALRKASVSSHHVCVVSIRVLAAWTLRVHEK